MIRFLRYFRRVFNSKSNIKKKYIYILINYVVKRKKNMRGGEND